MVAGLIAIICANNIYSLSDNSNDNKCNDCINCDDCDFEDIYDEDAYLNCGKYKSYNDYLDED